MEAVRQPMKSRKGALIKASILVAFVLVAIYVIRFTPVKGLLTPEALSRFLTAAGMWAPLVYMLVYAVGVCLFVPGTLLTAEVIASISRFAKRSPSLFTYRALLRGGAVFSTCLKAFSTFKSG